MDTVFITGAATGIGLATARRFAAEGCFVGLYDIDGERIRHLLAEPAFSRACGGRCDVTDRAEVTQALAHFAERTQGRLDVLVNNAGVIASGPFATVDPGAHDRIIDINVRGLTNVAQLAFPLLRETRGSALVNICSVSSVHGVPLLAVYSASKFYVDGLSQALAIEWAQHGIRVIAIKPPFVRTAMVEGLPGQLMKFITVDMEPGDVAEAITKALKGRRSSYLLGWKSRLWSALERCLPEGLRTRIVRQLTGF